MKKLLLTLAAASLVIGCLSGCGGKHQMTEVEKAKFVAEYLESHYNKNKNKDFVGEKNFLEKVDPVVCKIVNANDRMKGGTGDMPSYANHSLFVTDDSANVMITRYLGQEYHTDRTVNSYLVSVDSLLLYVDSAKKQGTPLTHFRMMHGIFDSAGKQARTLIFVGLDKENKYIRYGSNRVLEHCLPCPDQCPEINNVKISDYIKD